MHEGAPVRLTVLGGYLGSGKTTWLRHQARVGVFREAEIVINEVANLPVDQTLMPGARLSVLAGGCACCTSLDRLLVMLRALTARMEAAGDDARIVLETSGLADPAPLVAAIRADAALAGRLVVSEVLVAVDAVHGRGLLRAEGLARRQVQAADCLIVTKLDQIGSAEAAGLIASLQVLNPRAVMFAAVKGVEVPLPDPGPAIPEDFATASDQRPPIHAATLRLDDGMDWAAFSIWLSALLHARGDDVLRVKGVVRTPAGRMLVQTVKRLIQTPELLPEQAGIAADGADDHIVVIGRGYSAQDLRRSLRAFALLGRGTA